MAQKTYIYTIQGEPPAYAKVVDTEPRIWDHYKQAKFNYLQTLRNQHNCRQFVDGPIKIEATFFTKPSNHSKMINMFCFLNQAIRGIICRKDCEVKGVNLKQVSDYKPRTEIKIMRLS